MKSSVATATALFAVSFTGASAMIARVTPPLDADPVSAKLRYFEEHSDEFDVLFFGSSFVFRGIDPRTFDREMARRGVPTRSFNFGMGGMLWHETNALIRRTLASRPARLRWIVVEAGSPGRLREENWFTGRAISWHDFSETRSALVSAFAMETSAREGLRAAWIHLLHMAARYLPIGRGRDLLSDQTSNRIANRMRPLAESRGYEPLTPAEADLRLLRKHREFLGDQAGYAEAIRSLPSTNREERSLESYRSRAFEAQAAYIRRAGVEPIYLIPPIAFATPKLNTLERIGAVDTLWRFNDPVAHPDLYRAANRFDRHHLAGRGAELLSIALAERLAAHVRGTGS